jgi:hypothetical protein
MLFTVCLVLRFRLGTIPRLAAVRLQLAAEAGYWPRAASVNVPSWGQEARGTGPRREGLSTLAVERTAVTKPVRRALVG